MFRVVYPDYYFENATINSQQSDEPHVQDNVFSPVCITQGLTPWLRQLIVGFLTDTETTSIDQSNLYSAKDHNLYEPIAAEEI